MAKKSKKVKKAGKKLKKAQLEVNPQVIVPSPTIDRIKLLSNQLSNVSTYGDLAQAFTLTHQFQKEVEPVLAAKGGFEHLIENKSFGVYGLPDLFGYQPQSTQFFKIFPNPLAIFSYLAENHWAVLTCRNALYREIYADGYYLVGNKSNFANAQKIMERFKITDLRPMLADYLKTYGNFWIWPKTNLFGGLKDFQLLLPQFLTPIPTGDNQRIAAWQYQIGYEAIIFPKEALLHQQFRRSMRHYDVANPPLGSLLVDIEADIQASMFNNMVFQKGGLVGLAVLMEPVKGQTVPGVNNMNLARQMADELRANHSGARAGYETIVLNGAKEIKQIGSLKDMDGSFHKTSSKAAKQIALVMGVPYEEVGEVSNSKDQYHPASLEDKHALQFDKTLGELMRIVDGFINTYMLPRMGITDVQIRAKERYNAFTDKMATTLVNLGKLDGFCSKDEARVDIAKMPPLGGKEGQAPLRVLPNISVASEVLPPVRPVPLTVTELTDLNTISEGGEID